MTNEEARKVLQEQIDKYGQEYDAEGIEALDMAIKALEQQPCDDCISRADAIKIIKEHPSIVGNRSTIVQKIVDLPSVTPQTRWIPVSERLPEEQRIIGKYIFSENVLGTEGYTIKRAYYNYTTKEWFDGNEEMEWTEITHWMPLPEEPPKAEGEDEE